MADQIESLRVKIRTTLIRHDVKKAAVFGSFAHGTQTKKSDLDLLVEFKGKKSLLDLIGLKLELEKLLKRDVDVVTYRSLNPLVRDHILREQRLIL